MDGAVGENDDLGAIASSDADGVVVGVNADVVGDGAVEDDDFVVAVVVAVVVLPSGTNADSDHSGLL